MADYEPDCLFCKIAAGEIPSEIVHSDEQVVVFRDVNPRAPTHVLAITRRHIPSAAELTDADGELLAALFGALRRVAEEAGLRGYRIVTNVGADAGQSVFHLHLHMLAGRHMSWPPG
ncbi:MAG TPA: histidine triad nucleotide-binding protein [Candidatus Limnocylindrales bacterium]|nr:histidine triad nucleotide-binding protein [Candidatus Limnocylindrales bacterium]